MPIQLNDDHILEFVYDLHNFLENWPLVNDPVYRDNEGYDHLKDFVFNKLEKFSNGYMNYN
jgi:hypothetical protein